MSTETTPAIERASEAFASMVKAEWSGVGEWSITLSDGAMRRALAAALDVEDMAKAAHGSDFISTAGPDAAWDGEDEETKNDYRINARAIRTAILGGDDL